MLQCWFLQLKIQLKFLDFKGIILDFGIYKKFLIRKILKNQSVLYPHFIILKTL